MNSDDIKDDLFAQFPFLKEIDDKLNEAKEHKNLYESCLQEARDKFILLNIKNIPETKLLDFLSVYLLLEPLIPTDLIKQVLGTDKDGKAKYNNLPDKFHYLCPRCNEKIPFRSRTNAQSYLSGIISEDLYCNSCKKEITQEINRQHEFEREKYNELKDARQKRFLELHDMPYSEYLKTPEWQEIRKRKMKKAHYRCQICNTNGKLNVHHITYENRGKENDIDLIVLCEDCHKLYHNKGKIAEESEIYTIVETINE